MSQFVHIVYVHPVELGEPNLHKVKQEKEFEAVDAARNFEWNFNQDATAKGFALKAVYYGCVNDETGELV